MQLKTETYPTTPETKLSSTSWSDAGKIITSLSHEANFITLAQTADGILDTSSPAYADCLSQYVADFVEARQLDNLETPETLEKVILLGDLPSVVHAQLRLSQSDLPREETRNLKTLASEYNSKLYQYIDASPETSFSNFIESSYGYAKDMFPRQEAQLEESITQIARGVRAEKGFKDVAQQLGFGIIEGSTKEDLRGIDFFVQLPNPATGEIMKVLKVDIKSALTKVDSSNGGFNGKAYAIGRGHNVIFWPGFSDKDFNNNFQLTDDPERMKQILDFNAMQLFMASQEDGV